MDRAPGCVELHRERVLHSVRGLCSACGGSMQMRDENRRTLMVLSGAMRLQLKDAAAAEERQGCARRHRLYRPEAEGAIVLSQHEFELDVAVRQHPDTYLVALEQQGCQSTLPP